MTPREVLAAAVAGFTVALMFLIPPDPWMWIVWSIVAFVLALVATAIIWLGDRPTTEALRMMWPALIAGAAFAIVAVLAATLETRGSAGIIRNYSLLAVAMLAIVALFLMSYERSRFGQ